MTNPNFNSNTPGGLLQGIAGLVSGLRQFNDPDQQRRHELLDLLKSNPKLRDQYIEQYQDDPNTINAILGKKPILGSSNYDELQKTIALGHLSAEGEATRAKAKAEKQTADNDLALGQREGSIIKAGKLNEQVNRGLIDETGQLNPRARVGGGFEAPALMDMTGPEFGEFQELKTRQGIRTPLQREKEKAEAAKAKTEAKTSAGLEQNRAQEEARKVETRDASSRILASLKTGQTPYDAYKAGTVDPDTFSAAMDDPGFKATFEKGQDEFYRKEALKIDQDRLDLQKKSEFDRMNMEHRRADLEERRLNQQSADKKYENYARWLAEKSKGALSFDDAMLVAKNGNAPILKAAQAGDQHAQGIVEAMKKYDEPLLHGIAKDYSKAYKDWDKSLKSRPPTLDQVKELNAITGPIFAGSGVQRTIHGMDADGNMILVSGDPRLADTNSPQAPKGKITNKGGVPTVAKEEPTPDETFDAAVSRVSAKHNGDKNAIVAELQSEGWDVGKGVRKVVKKETVARPTVNKPTTKPTPKKPEFTADTTGLPSITRDSTSTQIEDAVQFAVDHDYPLEQVLRQVPSERQSEVINSYYRKKNKKK